ncbi:MAG: amidohydrolase [Chloroflexi bacterium]|nr:amidohydrolase [Chloroflexota bacterium]
MTETRRTLHQIPEPGFGEVETAGLVAAHLRALGLEVQEGVGITGVVGRLGQGRPCIALRADMDALPIQEETGQPYASRRAGYMHACGHDAHVTSLLGAAMLLAQQPPTQGEVRFLFQPSEEGPDAAGKSGAARMIDDGAMEGVDAVVGLHVDTNLLQGQLGFRVGPVMAAADRFTITIHGQGCHAAHPEKGVDAIVLAAQVIMALQTVISRRLPPTKGRVITVGTIEGGVRYNVVADTVKMGGTIRSYSPEVRAQLINEMEQACRIVEPLGGAFDLVIQEGFPVTVNEPAITGLVRQVAVELIGEAALAEIQPEMGAEDFSLLADKAPGCYLRLGVTTPGQPPRTIHSPTFDLDERALPLGAAILAGAALRFLA